MQADFLIQQHQPEITGPCAGGKHAKNAPLSGSPGRPGLPEGVDSSFLSALKEFTGEKGAIPGGNSALIKSAEGEAPGGESFFINPGTHFPGNMSLVGKAGRFLGTNEEQMIEALMGNWAAVSSSPGEISKIAGSNPEWSVAGNEISLDGKEQLLELGLALGSQQGLKEQGKRTSGILVVDPKAAEAGELLIRERGAVIQNDRAEGAGRTTSASDGPVVSGFQKGSVAQPLNVNGAPTISNAIKCEEGVDRTTTQIPEGRLFPEQDLSRPGNMATNTKALLDKIGTGEREESGMRDTPLKLNPDSRDIKMLNGKPSENTNNWETITKSQIDPLQIKQEGTEIKANDQNAVPNKAARIESHTGNQGFSFLSRQSTDTLSETSSNGKEPGVTQKPFQTEVLDQLVNRASLQLKNGRTEAKIDLKPEFLGKVRLQISTNNHQVMIKIMTDLPMVKEIIEYNVAQLKTDLQNHGLVVDKFDVFVSQDPGQKGAGSDTTGLHLTEEGPDHEEDRGGISDGEVEDTVPVTEEGSGVGVIDFFA